MGPNRIGLKNNSYIALFHRNIDSPGFRKDRLSRDGDLAFCRDFQTRDAAQSGRLTAAARSQEGDEIAFLYFKGERLDSQDFFFGCFVNLAQPNNVKHLSFSDHRVSLMSKFHVAAVCAVKFSSPISAAFPAARRHWSLLLLPFLPAAVNFSRSE